MPVPDSINKLVERFQTHEDDYKAADYKEASVRREFIDPFFRSLGWDMENNQGLPEAYKNVVHEYAIKIKGKHRAPDYAFRIGGERKFFLEAKKPSINIRDDIGPAFQLRRYAWSGKLALSILTDFEEFAVYDCRIKPLKGQKANVARIAFYRFEDYVKKWDEIESIFSCEAILDGSLDKYAEANKSRRGTEEIDDAFLEEIENWRELLARNLALRNRDLSIRELNYAVQRIIDRIIFLRIAEDRGIEPYGRLQELKDGTNIYRDLTRLFRKADERYNSGLFHFRRGDGSNETLDVLTLGLSIDDNTLRPIIGSLYYPDSPYEFSVISADILGQVYERFLGKIIRSSGKKVAIEEKPEVKKAGGVYYTPADIVRYIVGNTVRSLLVGKTPAQASALDGNKANQVPLRILDPACGSGSFLIEAYQYLLNWYRDQYAEHDPDKHTKGKSPKLYLVGKNDWRLTIEERRRILLTHIFGVDIDPQAVEVTKLSLLLKVLENETADPKALQMDFFSTRVLPDLGKNIRCGNSLISSDFFADKPLNLFSEDEQFRINAFDWKDEFPFLGDTDGFSVVIGNPPWISLTGKFRNEIYSKDERDYLVRRYEGNSYMPNMYEYFICKGLDLLAPNGYFSYIVPDRFGYNDQFKNLRRKVLKDFTLNEILYRAPFPNVTADTAIFNISHQPFKEDHHVAIGNYGDAPSRVLLAKLRDDERARFPYSGDEQTTRLIENIVNSQDTRPLRQVVRTTSGVGARSSEVSNRRTSDQQMEILKGSSIQKFGIGEHFYFEFKKENFTGRTTDPSKLGFAPKLLIRKTGNSLIAAFDDSGRYPEQSLYFTFGDSSEPLPYLLGLLNSRLMQFVFFNTALTNRDSIAQVKKIDLDELPIKIGAGNTEGVKERIGSLAMQLTELVRSARNERTEQGRLTRSRQIKATSLEIEDMVFDLYSFSSEEKKFVIQWHESQGFC